MGCDHHLIEAHGFAVRSSDFDAVRQAVDALHRCREANSIRKRRRDAFHIFARATDDGAPDRPIAQQQQAVIAAEFDEMRRRITADLHGRRGPDGRSHGIKMIVAKR